MILVFGGTTEGKIVTQALEVANFKHFYSTKTQIDFTSSVAASYRFGAFSQDSLIDFCRLNQIKLIIHASHPFALELHKIIEIASQKLEIPVLRFERNFPEKTNHPLVTYFKSYEEAIAFLLSKEIKNLLALTGVQTISLLKPYWSKYPAVFRILPRDTSIKIAKEAGFPKENLLLEMATSSLEGEIATIEKFNIKCILTKESGESGFLSTKIKAALKSEIPILIIEKPPIPASFIKLYCQEDLLSKMYSLV